MIKAHVPFLKLEEAQSVVIPATIIDHKRFWFLIKKYLFLFIFIYRHDEKVHGGTVPDYTKKSNLKSE